MDSFDEIGTGLFILIITINLFMSAFVGTALPTAYTPFVNDSNAFFEHQYGY
jgi:hypothetical protein